MMLVLGTFVHSIELEYALADLRKLGIAREHVLVVFMQRGDGLTNEEIRARAVEMGVAVATGFAVIGASAGFVLDWGPIAWGLIGTVTGYVIGYRAYLSARPLKRAAEPSRRPDVTIVIQCEEERAERVRETLFEHKALTVGVTPEPESI